MAGVVNWDLDIEELEIALLSLPPWKLRKACEYQRVLYQSNKADVVSGIIEKIKARTSKFRIDNKGLLSKGNDLCVYGYIRINYEHLFPVDIIKLIIFYYFEGITWAFSNDEIKLFKTVNRFQKLYSEPFDICDTGSVFKYILYPNSAEDPPHISNKYNYSHQKKTGNINFGLHMEHVSKNIEFIQIYLEMKCLETDKSYKITNNFGAHQIESTVCFPLAELKRVETFKQLTFIGCIDVLCIKYRANHRLNNDLRFMNLTKMSKTCDFTWELKKNFIQLQKQRNKPCLYSDNFNNNTFVLFFSRKMGLDALFHRHGLLPLCVGIKLLRIPENVKKMDIMCNIIVNKKKIKRRLLIQSGWIQYFEIKNTKIDLNIYVEITIISVYNYKDEMIAEDEWEQYRIA